MHPELGPPPPPPCPGGKVSLGAHRVILENPRVIICTRGEGHRVVLWDLARCLGILDMAAECFSNAMGK